VRELHSLHDLSGYALHARDGDIGRLRQVYFDDRDWRVRYLVVRSGGWLFGREVLLSPDMVLGVDGERECIDVDLTREQIRTAPPVEEHLPVSRHYEREFYLHYGMQPYWIDDPLFGLGLATPPLADDETPSEPSEPHLRSSTEVAGYRMRADEHEVGHVDDLIVDEATWIIRYLDVKTGPWLFGRHVLIAAAWLDGVDWSAREVVTVLQPDAIETAPAYDRDAVIGQDDEIALYKHYGQHYEGER
jgi:hypothetical protein